MQNKRQKKIPIQSNNNASGQTQDKDKKTKPTKNGIGWDTIETIEVTIPLSPASVKCDG